MIYRTTCMVQNQKVGVRFEPVMVLWKGNTCQDPILYLVDADYE
ncbi:hypothetical protein HYP99_gp102 [Sinorhizobium phage ort11]|uniref:Uncharacterized protein n=1 Tax=Sinorhizobium phage ort11 TaxID=2599764 RepID=A0A5C2H7D4_9CAUD|nr:hypothetical protein HYP99_gp102 [Sinorhizobium phage ort11]QEP29891.1 hypothetical protein Smphiort11_093 [Sinorhizobium phage ort11]